jgi:hypothetical protein
MRPFKFCLRILLWLPLLLTLGLAEEVVAVCEDVGSWLEPPTREKQP